MKKLIPLLCLLGLHKPGRVYREIRNGKRWKGRNCLRCRKALMYKQD